MHRKLGYFAATYDFSFLTDGLIATVSAVSLDFGLSITVNIDMSKIYSALGSGILYLIFIGKVVWAMMASS